ncbi:MAG: DUF4381 domain-containing protein [Gammaproteobacteria bacterium]|nr:DUF4381 domain-containing protein [Gammaproteobacteria bacterium]
MNHQTPPSPTPDDPLATLRDIHLPDPVAFWPPAPGWWVVLGLVLAALAIFLFARKRHADAPRRAALEELDRIRSTFASSGDARAAVSDVSTILRRFALQHFPGRDVASLVNQDWLEFLDTSAVGVCGQFKNEVATLLTEGPYARRAPADPSPLFEAAEQWIKTVRNSQHKTKERPLIPGLEHGDDTGN